VEEGENVPGVEGGDETESSSRDLDTGGMVDAELSDTKEHEGDW
jgi:hypothetical protein